jgi:hypothetical protein
MMLDKYSNDLAGAEHFAYGESLRSIYQTNLGGPMTPTTTYTVTLTKSQVLDVLASIDTMISVVQGGDNQGRLTALLDNIAAQVGALKE